MRGKFIANVDDIRPQFRTEENAFLSQNAIFNSTLIPDNGIEVGATTDEPSSAAPKAPASRKKRSPGTPTRSFPST